MDKQSTEFMTRYLYEAQESREMPDIQRMIQYLETEGIDPADAFAELLTDPSKADLHYYAIVGMTMLADFRRLRGNAARLLLDGVKRLSWQLGTDEFYKAITALARSP